MKKQGRKTNRLPDYDYRQPGAYFVTLTTRNRQTLFGSISGEDVILNKFGLVAEAKWLNIPHHFPHVELDTFIVMPNHVHGILNITKTPVGARHASPLLGPRGVLPGSLGAIIGSYKSAVSRALNQIRQSPGETVWQRNYFERVIRNERELDEIRHYIIHNALTL